jgi:PAS domain S-box-containing protein
MQQVTRQRWHDILVGLAVTAAYFAAGKIGLTLASVNPSATAVWAPTGIALAAFLVLGYRIWPGVLLGAFLVNVTTAGTTATALGIAVGNTLEGLLGCYLVRRYAGGRHVFDQPDSIFKFAVLAGLIAATVSATLGATTLWLGGLAAQEDLAPVWITWWLGDCAGALIVTPLAMLWWLEHRISWTPRQWAELGIHFIALTSFALLVFSAWSPFHDKSYPIEYLCFPAVFLIAFRFGPRESATSLALLAGIAIHGTLKGHGPFAGWPLNESLLLLQGFLAVLSVMALATAAAMVGRRRGETSVRHLNEDLERRVTDRTERLSRANEDLRESEARLREAQHAARMGSWVWDIEANSIWWSEELYSIYGLDSNTFSATYEGYLERIHPEDRAHAREVVSGALREKRPFAFEHRIVRPDGTIRFVLGQGDVIPGPKGGPVQMMGSSQDITELKLAEIERAALRIEQAAREEAERANRLKDEFLATLSHELRTPLNAIVGWADLLKEGKLDAATTKRAVETINRNVKIQSHLISDILDISRMTSGQLDLKMQPVHLAAAIEGAFDTMRPMAHAKNVALEREVDQLSASVPGDPDRLQQIVWNLLSNAIKFAPQGGHVTVRLAQEGSRARIDVEDDGPGIDPDFLPYVFERFRQRDSTGTRRYGGLGLGLAIVRHLVELHGGTVTATNRRDTKGACFVVTLPLADGRNVPPSVEPASDGDGKACGPGDHAKPLRGRRILLVEDDRDSRELVAMYLTDCGADVEAVGSASEALSSLARHRPDALISDIAMPGMSGYDLIEKVRAMSLEKGGTVPAVALTAYAAKEDVSKALRAGFDAHMAKPVEMNRLVLKVHDLILVQLQKG